MKILNILFLITLILSLTTGTFSREKDTTSFSAPNSQQTGLISVFNDVTISGQWFLAYQTSRINEKKANEFLLRRGYLTIQKKFSDKISGRITQDISVDQEGDGEGDIELRLKFGYLRYQLGSVLFLKKSYVDFGLVKRPWIDFEQTINRYRVQGPMYLDTYNLLSSADYGVSVTSLFGENLDKNYKENISGAYPGEYGSITMGIYNGGGYHAIEKNQNKIFEGRISLRPIPLSLPGLQFSYVKLFGKGNSGQSPDYILDLLSASYQHTYFSLMTTWVDATGDENGESVDPSGKSIDIDGFSIFAEVNILDFDLSVVGRYDLLRKNYTPAVDYERQIIGLAYHFLGGNKILLNWEIEKKSDSNLKDDQILGFNIELKF